MASLRHGASGPGKKNDQAVEKACRLRSRFTQTLNVPKNVRFGLSLAAAFPTVFLNSLKALRN
jgi:hypothetical protein